MSQASILLLSAGKRGERDGKRGPPRGIEVAPPQEPALSTQAELLSSASTGTLPQGLALQLLGSPCL